MKLEIGSAYPLREEVQAEIRGRDMITGLPKTVVLSSEDVREALEEPMVQIIDAVKSTLDKTPPELASDIMDRGIMLAGGGSLLQGLDERLRRETEMPIHVAESPLTCVAVGSGRSLEEFEVMQKASCQRPTPEALLIRSTPTPRAPADGRARNLGIARRRATVRRGIIAALVIVCLVIFTGYFREADDGPLHGAQSTAASVIAPVQEVATRAVAAVPRRVGLGDQPQGRPRPRGEPRDAGRPPARRGRVQRRLAPSGSTELEKLLGVEKLVDASKDLGGYEARTSSVVTRSMSPWCRSGARRIGSSDGVSCATRRCWPAASRAPPWSAS